MSQYDLLAQYCESSQLSFPSNQEEADKVLLMLGYDLSNEIIYMDGEASEREAQQRRSYCHSVAKLVFSMGFALHGEVTQTDGYYDLLEVLNEG